MVDDVTVVRKSFKGARCWSRSYLICPTYPIYLLIIQIAAFGSRLEDSRALQLHADDFGFAKSFSYEERYTLRVLFVYLDFFIHSSSV